MRFRTPLAALGLVSLLGGPTGATVPGAQTAPPLSARPRIVNLTSSHDLSKSDQAAIFEEYVQAFRSASAAHNQALERELAEHATLVFPAWRRPWCHLAAARVQLQQWGPAIEAARHAETCRDDAYAPPFSPDEGAAGAAYWEGWALYCTQRYPEALPKMQLARTRAPRWAEAARALGEVAFVAGHSADAAVAYGAAFDLDATIGTAHDLAYYAEARSAGGDLDGGIAALQEALHRAPFEPGLHAKQGDLLRRQGHWSEAWYELVEEALLHGMDGRYSQAAVAMAQSLVDSVKVQKTNPAQHELLVVSSGLASLDAGEPHHAIHQLQHLLEISRTASPVPRLLLADALHRDEQDDPSRAVLEQVLSTDPDCVPALTLLSDVQTKLGHPREAQAALQRARALYPGYWKLKAKSAAN